MTRRAILQIGTEKTGSTTLQHFLAVNRAALLANGYQYPLFCGDKNHVGLAVYALSPDKDDVLRDAYGYSGPTDLPGLRVHMATAARAELDGSKTALFCSEHCHSRLTTTAELTTLRDFLAEFFDDIQISVYLRRQDQVALSLYSTQLKSGAEHQRLLPQTDGQDHYYNYDRSLTLWESVFGRENIHARLFDRAELVGGSIVTDFVAQWQIAPDAAFKPVADVNRSITAEAQEFLRLVNGHLAALPGAADPKLRGPLVVKLEDQFTGRGARPARADAEAFFARYEASNERVRQRYFPDRPALFSTDFSTYPAQEEPRALSADRATHIAARLHAAFNGEIRRLEAEVALRDARLHVQNQDLPKAIAALRRSVDWRPDQPETHRMLAENLLRNNQLADAATHATKAVTLRPTCAEYHHFLGLVLRKSGDDQQALAAQQMVLTLEPDHPRALHELALLRPPETGQGHHLEA